jgi:hypothetical protein
MAMASSVQPRYGRSNDKQGNADMYSIPVLVLEGQDVTQARMFTVDTKLGRVVVLFADQQRLERFRDALAPSLATNGNRLAFVESAFNSVEEAVRSLIAARVIRPGEANFITDDDPLYIRLVEEIESGALG